MNLIRPYLGRLIFTVLGLVVAILFMVIGFAKTMLIILCCTIGYAVGAHTDGVFRLTGWFNLWRDRWH